MNASLQFTIYIRATKNPRRDEASFRRSARARLESAIYSMAQDWPILGFSVDHGQAIDETTHQIELEHRIR